MGLAFGSFEALFLLVVAVLYVGSVVWVYRDAESQGKKGWVMAALVALFFWPLSLGAWILLRPREAP